MRRNDITGLRGLLVTKALLAEQPALPCSCRTGTSCTAPHFSALERLRKPWVTISLQGLHFAFCKIPWEIWPINIFHPEYNKAYPLTRFGQFMSPQPSRVPEILLWTSQTCPEIVQEIPKSAMCTS